MKAVTADGCDVNAYSFIPAEASLVRCPYATVGIHV